MASDDAVPLTELDVITRWSLAVRQPTVDRAELIRVLRSDLEFLEKDAAAVAEPAAPTAETPAIPAKRPRKTPVKRAPAKTAVRRSTTDG